MRKVFLKGYLLALPFTSVVWPSTTQEAPLLESEFVRQSGDKLVVGVKNQPLYLRGVNLMCFFMIDRDNGAWYTEGAAGRGYPFPAPDEDKPAIMSPKYLEWYNEEHFAMIGETGFNVIRVTMTYRIFEDNSNAMIYTQEGWDFLDKYIRWAKSHNLYLILNIAVPQGGYQPGGGGAALWREAELQRRFSSLWKAIAERYADEPVIAGYDLLDEPHPISAKTDSEGDNKQWKRLVQQVIDDIRSVDRNHLIIVEAVNWIKGIRNWSIEVLDSFQFLVDDDNVMYDIHPYYPYEYLIREPPNPPEYPCNKRSCRKVDTIDSRKLKFNRDYLEGEVQTVLKFSKTNNVPMNFGEWSSRAVFRKGGLDYIRDMLSIFEKYKVHWTFWSFNHFYDGQMRKENLVGGRIGIFEEYFKTSDTTPPGHAKRLESRFRKGT